MEIKVSSGNQIVTAKVERCRKFPGRLFSNRVFLLVRFGPDNAQWIEENDKCLLLTDEQRQQMKLP